MPIEVVRFGVGHRRPHGPAGTTGLQGQVIHSDPRGVIAELAFARGGSITPHSNPNTTWFVVIEGGGWVQVGDERIRVQAGDAVLWPADVDHGAWTEHLTMRAIVVEFADAAAGHVPLIVEGAALPVPSDAADAAARGEGRLAPRAAPATVPDPGAGEPL